MTGSNANIEALGHITYDGKIFSRFQEKEGGMRVELGDAATYHVKGLGSTSFEMSPSDVLESDSVLYVTYLMKSLISVSCMIDLQCLTKFDG